MKKAALFSNNLERVGYVYAKGRRERLGQIVDLYPEVVTSKNFEQHGEALSDLEVIFSTWGMPPLTGEQIETMPSLKAVFYAAGSVTKFARPFLERGVIVVSAWAANAIPVAEFCVGQILLSCKGYFRNTRQCQTLEGRRSNPFRGAGVFGETVGLIGAGQVGRATIERLKPFCLRVKVCDPYLSDAAADELGVEKASLEDLFATSYVVSNHLPNIPETVGILDGALFGRMRDDATFINTGRGAQVVEDDLVRELEARPSLTALLDVTSPEPPGGNSKFYTLPNVQLSSHIAGSNNDEVLRMADTMMEEFESWQAGRPLRYGVELDMLDRLG